MLFVHGSVLFICCGIMVSFRDVTLKKTRTSKGLPPRTCPMHVTVRSTVIGICNLTDPNSIDQLLAIPCSAAFLSICVWVPSVDHVVFNMKVACWPS